MDTDERHCRSGGRVRTLVVATMVLVAGLAGCGGDSDDASLTVAQLRKLIEAGPVTKIHFVTRADFDGELTTISDATMVVEDENERTRTVIEANEQTGMSGQTQVSIGSTMYVRRDGSEKWNRIDLVAGLVENLDSPNGQMGFPDLLQFTGGDLRAEGTETRDGRTVEVYRADVDWSAYLEATEGTDDYLRSMWEQLPTDAEFDIAFTAFVEESGALHDLALNADVTNEGETVKFVNGMTLLDAEGVDPVKAPDAGDIGETVSVSTMEEFQQALSGIMQNA